MDKNLERFVKYCKIDTQSDSTSSLIPSTPKQLNLTKELLKDLNEMGIKGEIDEFGLLYAKLPGEEGLDPIGLNAHVDTAEEITDTNCSPRYIENYDGGTIRLNETYSMGPEQFPCLSKFKGDDLIVTDGNTLLGADDKAGIAIIMAALDYYTSHPEKKHHPVCILFSNDEEIGRGPDHFDAEKFGAAYAYTIDGEVYDTASYENFNAAHAFVNIKGVTVHPGEAKDQMVNAGSLACEFDGLLPALSRPQYTEWREGFVHLISMEGECDKARMRYIIRDHDREKLAALKDTFIRARDELRSKYPKAEIEVELYDDYRNMKECIDKDPRCIERIEKTFAKLGHKIVYKPMRGGTDGAGFSFKGCPTPNLGTGSYNHHGRFEFLSVGEFNKMVEIVITLLSADLK